MMAKIDVNGASEHPLYTWVKARCGAASDVFCDQPFITWSPVFNYDITWNFEKFLFDGTGQPYRRYSPAISPSQLVSDITYLLNNLPSY